MKPNILFMGSSEFSVPILNSLHESYKVCVVATQPDKPAGRGKRIESPIIKTLALDLGLSLLQPIRLEKENILYECKKHDIQMIIVAAYGKILPGWLLEYPKFSALNVHASLLPKWRGASPIQAAILYGDTKTGITIMKMDEGLDTGDILSQQAMDISDVDTAASLSRKLAIAGASLLKNTIDEYIQGYITPRKQISEEATYSRLIMKEDGRLDFNRSAEEIERRIRAYNPWPVCYYEWNSEKLRIYKAEILDNQNLLPSQHGIIKKYPCIGTTTSTLLLKEVQTSGKNRMEGKAFLNGAKNWLEKTL